MKTVVSGPSNRIQVMGTTGEDCDKKTVELEVMEVI